MPMLSCCSHPVFTAPRLNDRREFVNQFPGFFAEFSKSYRVQGFRQSFFSEPGVESGQKALTAASGGDTMMA
jgi:hypothetical protein